MSDPEDVTNWVAGWSIKPDPRGYDCFEVPDHPTKEKVEEMIGGPIPQDIWEFQPWGPRILVRQDLPEDKIGSIFVPETAKEPLQSGIVVKVGPGVGEKGNRESSPYLTQAALVGLPVIFGQWAGKTIYSGEDSRRDPYAGLWVLMHEDDIWGHSNREPSKAPKEE